MLKIYLAMAVLIGGIVFGMDYFFGADIASWAQARKVDTQVRNVEALGTIVFEPVRFVFSNRPLGAIFAGLLWPFVLVWLPLILLGLVAIAGLDVAVDVESVTQLMILFIIPSRFL